MVQSIRRSDLAKCSLIESILLCRSLDEQANFGMMERQIFETGENQSWRPIPMITLDQA
jgi:hypothetical protein